MPLQRSSLCMVAQARSFFAFSFKMFTHFAAPASVGDISLLEGLATLPLFFESPRMLTPLRVPSAAKLLDQSIAKGISSPRSSLFTRVVSSPQHGPAATTHAQSPSALSQQMPGSLLDETQATQPQPALLLQLTQSTCSTGSRSGTPKAGTRDRGTERVFVYARTRKHRRVGG
jgi:hypothetical protein